jgi:hypothetical protein
MGHRHQVTIWAHRVGDARVPLDPVEDAPIFDNSHQRGHGIDGPDLRGRRGRDRMGARGQEGSEHRARQERGVEAAHGFHVVRVRRGAGCDRQTKEIVVFGTVARLDAWRR